MFSGKPFENHVVGIGNAIVDVIAKCEDNFLKRHNLVKGAMALIDQETALSARLVMTRWVRFSGTISDQLG